MKFFTTIFVLCGAIYAVNGLCNTCSATSGLACVAEDKFQVCLDGFPKPPSIPCPEGSVCTPNAQVCAPAGSVPSSCARCMKCDANHVFACTDFNAFTLCYGAEEPDETVEYDCPGRLVCNLDSPHICVDSNTTGLGATCPLVEIITQPPTTEEALTTTPNPETQSDSYCEYRGLSGRYEITTDTACQKYISCVLTEGVWTGNLYECPKETFFSPTKQMCGVEKPDRCM